MKIMDNEFIKNITEEGDNVMRILFICGNGVSSGMIASRTGKAGKAQGYDVDKEAFREATSGMISDYCEQYPGVKKLLDIIDSVE